ncbi:uncharacterized protein EURHEDRAFT_71280 [Aspergillus ruber CBS 135680]|uniref:Uncharacterized protein n=1 Tax=Aspergillus ruber (strain CBS 135680) TaxID=1388766 RepID=A0A017SDU5_ASPRC|nr:uncharacterized protein EURHEDRAFT_71280 [Aspergillus ruber CBS 135680]EYE94814.1 hypothetical protein EURHEDRAFT_71280 [Aspergillus ruber CBS 135680]
MLYAIRTWLSLETSNDRVYTYWFHPTVPASTEQEIHERSQPTVHKTPADYLPPALGYLRTPKTPLMTVLGRRSK